MFPGYPQLRGGLSHVPRFVAESFITQRAHRRESRATRAFLCASSPDWGGCYMLDCALKSLVQDGDKLIVFKGVDGEDLGTWHTSELLQMLNHNLQKDHA
jgi:hypothetical protein